jgi:hypothetical protein
MSPGKAIQEKVDLNDGRGLQTPPAHIAQLIESICATDRRWFEANPNAHERIRPYVHREFWPYDGDVCYVHVTQIAPCMRVRQPICRVKAKALRSNEVAS